MGIDVSLDDIKKLTPRFTVSLRPYVVTCTRADAIIKPSFEASSDVKKTHIFPSGVITVMSDVTSLEV